MQPERADLSYFELESPDVQMHVCALAVLERAVPLDALRAELSARIPPVMRQRFDGRRFVDHASFDVREHVFEAPAVELERRIGEPLDRGRPLWQLIQLTGGAAPALLIKLHHAIADGLAALALISELFGAPLPAPRPGPPPPASGRSRSLGRLMSFAPKSSLNHPVRAGRRFTWSRLDLAAVRERAHAAGAHVNDVVLDVVCASLRPLLAARHELTPGLVLKATVPVSLRAAGDVRPGNAVGGMVVELPVGEPDPSRRLAAIAASTRRAKAEQTAAILPVLIGKLTRRFRWLFTLQRLVNVFVTNVPGPAAPIRVLGARIVDLVPISNPAGNVGVTFAALSYAGSLYVSATVDASRFPDFALLEQGLRGGREPPPARVTAPGPALAPP